MTEISLALNQILNLSAAAQCHKKHCNDSDCGVSLYVLKLSALSSRHNVWTSELEEADRIIQDWPR